LTEELDSFIGGEGVLILPTDADELATDFMLKVGRNERLDMHDARRMQPIVHSLWAMRCLMVEGMVEGIAA
jgi:hypothetical protein